MQACAMYNLGYTAAHGGPQCKVVAVVKSAGDFCYLKSATGNNVSDSSGVGISIDSALLLS